MHVCVFSEKNGIVSFSYACIGDRRKTTIMADINVILDAITNKKVVNQT